MSMTSEAKGHLASTIGALRAFLIGDGQTTGALHHAVEGAYRMSVRARDAGLAEVPHQKRRRLETWIEEQIRIERSAGHGKSNEKDVADLDALHAHFRADAEKQAAYT